MLTRVLWSHGHLPRLLRPGRRRGALLLLPGRAGSTPATRVAAEPAMWVLEAVLPRECVWVLLLLLRVVLLLLLLRRGEVRSGGARVRAAEGVHRVHAHRREWGRIARGRRRRGDVDIRALCSLEEVRWERGYCIYIR